MPEALDVAAVPNVPTVGVVVATAIRWLAFILAPALDSLSLRESIAIGALPLWR